MTAIRTTQKETTMNADPEMPASSEEGADVAVELSESDAMSASTGDAGQWHDIDSSGRSNRFVSYLDALRPLGAIGACKARSLEWLSLADGEVALDAGCGLGDDARSMGRRVGPGGLVWGIDTSAVMIEESIRRSEDVPVPVRFRVASVDATGFPDATFDAIRSDRVFQHLSDPMAAARELVRVLKPGGRIAISDPDWGSLVIDGPDSAAMTAYLSFIARQPKNPWSGRRLYALLRAAGLSQIEVAADSLHFLDHPTFERATGTEVLAAATAAGVISAQDAESLGADLRARHERGCFFASVTIFTLFGRKP